MSGPGFRATIVGLSRLKRRMTEIEKVAAESTWKALVATGLMIHKDAVLAVQRGPKTGNVYDRGAKGYHQASKAGEAPASDTGNLARNIRFKPDKATRSVSIVARTPYAAYLEFGTRGNPGRGIPPLQPRPFMGPAFHKNREWPAKLLKINWKQTFKPPTKE